jgi:hypothetical protein
MVSKAGSSGELDHELDSIEFYGLFNPPVSPTVLFAR